MKNVQNEYADMATLFEALIRTKKDGTAPLRILDFGCGEGNLVNELRRRGYDGYGCDVWGHYSASSPSREFLRKIPVDPYRIPYDDNFFDVVISTSVFEHAHNKEECFREIHRVLKHGGSSIHLFPAKWYLPVEPHIYVPLISWIWPYVPKWWLALWAFLGVRNEFQKGKSWKEVRDLNYKFCKEGINYWPTKRYKELAIKVFGNCSYPMQTYIENSKGGYASLARKLPFKNVAGLVSRECRIVIMEQKKISA